MRDINEIEKILKERKNKPVGKHNFFSVIIPICCPEISSERGGKAELRPEKHSERAMQHSDPGVHRYDSGEDGLKLLFEVRSSKLKNQPGDICFPGGKVEKGETPLKAALREFEEETGIPGSEIEVVAQFDTLYGFADYTVYTFAARINESSLSKIKINAEEVEEIFTVPLKFFKDNPPKVYELDIVSESENFPYEETGISPGYSWRKGKNVLPVYHAGNRVIWGMTARIVKQFAEEIL